ncbi:hypothetical protein [Streptomyces sp. NPDC058867]|uniref:hypothetical protein n=1 Tax=unclassified Streptomyces TaxID=2593676 RepID=UPI003692D7AF
MLRATTWTHGRRGALTGASAAVVCLGGLLAACAGGGDRDGYVAVGAPGGTAAADASPSGEVSLVPLEPRHSRGAAADSRGDDRGSGPIPGAPGADGNPPVRGADPGRAPASSPTAPSTAPDRPGDGTSGPSGTAGAPGTPASPATPPAPAAPAALVWAEPEREAAEKRWCEKVTLAFHNTGGSPVRSGTVTFGTHIIGALGVDWGTVGSAVELPAPIGAGARKERTWTVCVDAWRVPLGMHVETRDVSVEWK